MLLPSQSGQELKRALVGPGARCTGRTLCSRQLSGWSAGHELYMDLVFAVLLKASGPTEYVVSKLQQAQPMSEARCDIEVSSLAFCTLCARNVGGLHAGTSPAYAWCRLYHSISIHSLWPAALPISSISISSTDPFALTLVSPRSSLSAFILALHTILSL